MAFQRIDNDPKTFHKNITSAATGSVWTVNQKADTINIEFISTATSFTAKFEGSYDGAVWHGVAATTSTTGDFVNQITDAYPIYSIDLDSWSHIRVNVTAVSGGILTCNGYYGMVVGNND